MAHQPGNDLSEKLERLKNACSIVSIPLVRARIHGFLDAHHLDLDEDSFISLIVHEKPSAVFYQVSAYDPEQFIRSTMMAHGWKEGLAKDRESIWPTPNEIKAELSLDLANIESQIGLPHALIATYAIHGQHRICWLFAAWAEELESRIDEIVESRHERAEAARDGMAITLESLIAEIANDPEFRSIRGRPKKLLFLQKKYGPRIPPHPRGQLVRPAQNCDYVDEHVANVLIKADERAWSDENLG